MTVSERTGGKVKELVTTYVYRFTKDMVKINGEYVSGSNLKMRNLAFKYRIYPNEEQTRYLAQHFGCARFVWNQLLAGNLEEQEAVDEDGKTFKFKSIKKGSASLKRLGTGLTSLKNQYEWLREIGSTPLTQVLRNMIHAFQNFFRERKKSNKEQGIPKFKSRSNHQSIRYCGYNSNFRINKSGIQLQKFPEPIPVVWTRDIPEGSKINNCTISKTPCGKYFVSIAFEGDIQLKQKSGDGTVGLDMGLESFVTTSDGTKYQHPKPLGKLARKLARAQRIQCRRKKASINRDKARIAVARIHSKIADVRKDFIHKLSIKLIRENQTISIENLNIKGMMKNKRLAKAIADVSWSEFKRQLLYKAEWYGRRIFSVGQWFPSSKTCSGCGYVASQMPLGKRKWQCHECGMNHDRDENAARNISTAGLAGC